MSHNTLSESEIDNMVSKKDKAKDMNFKQLKLKIHDTYKKDGKITTNFQQIDDEDVTGKAHLDESFL